MQILGQSPLRKRQKLGDLDVGKEKLSAILSKKSKHEHLVDKVTEKTTRSLNLNQFQFLVFFCTTG